MSASEATIRAALLWADRMKQGEAQYDEYLVGLAGEVRRLREENEALRAVNNLSAAEIDLARELADRAKDHLAALSDLREAKARIADLEARITSASELTKRGLAVLNHQGGRI